MDTSKAPLRAEMATCINAPTGIVESSALYAKKPGPPAHLLERRKKMKDALIQRFSKQHGSDRVRVALITREVDSCQALMAGTLTAEGLKSLEQAVAKAVSAAIPKLPPMMSNGSTMPPRRGNPKTDFAVDLKKHADWTEVGRYRSNYFAVEQQRRAETRQARQDELNELLSHQIHQVEQNQKLRKYQLEQESIEMRKRQQEYDAQERLAAEQRKAKMKHEAEVREAQMKEIKARRAAADRLQKLEDEELMRSIEREKEEMRQKAREKQLKDEEYHQKAKEANDAARRAREEAQRQEWEEEIRLNKEWKEMLDKQEWERDEANRKRVERISKQSKDYEDTTGAAIAARDKHEEDMRNMWIEKHERETLAAEEGRREKRKNDNRLCTEYQLEQSKDIARARRREREDEVRRRHEIAAEAEADRERSEQAKADLRAKALKQQMLLTEQMHERERNKHQDPDSSTMTPLEALLNRSLLVSMAQHTYEAPNVLQ
ncbi:hypothetical protein AB1Y20_004101 [Prymnesium parvum]|uniref:Trichohyalin-plectin-homology domain-containing protein n=1 Tax=Prymnesium parvum TaxID=97485 RepID=A0AB34J871_PRYPA